MARLALLALLLLACGAPPVTKGTVISREHIDSYTTYSDMCVAYDKQGFCRQSVPIPQFHADQWQLQLRDDTQDKPEKDRDTGWVEVTENEWGRYHPGDHYP